MMGEGVGYISRKWRNWHQSDRPTYTYVTKFGERALSDAGPAAWNSLPADIQTTTSTFNKKLTTF